MMDELEDVVTCRFCEAIILYKDKTCKFCNAEQTYIIPDPLKNLQLFECIELIDNAFFRFESFMKGKINYYNYFGFNDYFTKLFYEVRKEENFTPKNCDLISPYWYLTYQLNIDIDKGNYENEYATKNESFYNDWNELSFLSWNRRREFQDFDINEYVESKHSITDLITGRNIQTQQKNTEKYVEIFSKNGFVLFEHILNQYVKIKRGRLSDIHYFYWAMFNDTNKFIHQRPEPFKEWFFKNYTEDLGKIKTLKQVQNPDRDKHYSTALDWFKAQDQ